MTIVRQRFLDSRINPFYWPPNRLNNHLLVSTTVYSMDNLAKSGGVYFTSAGAYAKLFQAMTQSGSDDKWRYV